MNAKVQVVMRGMGGIGAWSKHRGEIAAGRETQGRQEPTIRIAFVGHRRKVVRTALQGAASIAGLIVTTEATITEHPKKEAPAMPGGGMVAWADDL